MNKAELINRVSESVEGGVRFIVFGVGPVRDSIRRTIAAHATTMNRSGGWHFASAETEDGAALTVTASASDAMKLKALGFIGVMAQGMHHQAHHLAIARGGAPHH